MESYNRALREKKDLEKKINMYAKEYKSTVSTIDMEKTYIEGGLLDVQSKTTSLTDTVSSIASKLKEERKKLYDKLARVNELKDHPQTRRRGNREAVIAELEKQEAQLQRQIDISNMKLELITGQKQLPEVNKTMGVISIMTKKKGFGALLSNIRKNKAEQTKLPQVKPETPKPDFESPRNVSELISEFHKLPKLYPRKPKKKKPEATKVLMEEYDERRKQREQAMNYGTRARIKRAQFHCDSLTCLYIPTKNAQRSLQRKTSLVTIPVSKDVPRPMRRAMTH